MSFWRQLTRGLRGTFRRTAADQDVADEVQHYLDQATAAHLKRGLAPDEARRAARLEVGSPTAAREAARSYGWENALHTVAADVRFTLRVLRKNPIFTAVAVAAIALGTGAVTTVFSGMNALVLRPLPGTTETDRLVQIERRRPNSDERIQASYHFYDYLRRNARSLEGLAVWSRVGFTVAEGREGVAVYGNLVSGNYFSVFGVRPALGRFFAPEEDQTPLAHPVLVISHGLWTRRFGGDSAAVGREVIVNGRPYTIIGVAPPEFRGAFTPLMVDAWVPLMMQAHLRPGRNLEHAVWLWTFGRLAEGSSRGAAQRELESLTARYAAERVEPESRAPYTGILLASMTGLPSDAQAMAIGFIGLLLGVATLVLLIASVNVAAMLSARALSRQRELAVRAALGGGRARLVRQLLTEILVLFTLGAAGGMVLAVQATSALERLQLPMDVPLVLEISPDLRVFAFALALSLVTGLVFGLAPALRATKADIVARLRDGTTGAGARRRVLGNALIVGQLALSLVLLVSAGLLLRALDRGAKADPGFDPAGVSVAEFNMETFGYDSAQGRAFFSTLRERVRAIPGVEAVTYTTNTPLAFATSGGTIQIPGRTPASNDVNAGEPIQLSLVDAEYLAVLRIPLQSGRAIAETDDESAPRVAVVNETFARRFWPNGSALGQTFTYLRQRITIVGVAADAKYGSLSEQTPGFAYFPVRQQIPTSLVMLVRSTSSPEAMATGIQAAVRAIDPLLPRPLVTTLRQSNAIVLLPQRIAAIVTGVMGGVGLLLATLGLYGIIAYSVNRRTREIGLRVALGAARRDVVRLIVREGMRLAVVGVLVGLVLAVAATRLLSGLLFSVSPLDATTFIAMSALFVTVAFVASYLPARRAAGADPMAALRGE